MPFERRTAWLAALVLVVLLCYFAPNSNTVPLRQDDVPRMRVTVEIVFLPVVATTREGRHVTDLNSADFQVYEDGKQQEIAAFATTDEPVSVALLLDTSGSTEFQLNQIRAEAIRFLNLLRPEDAFAILSFADHVTLLEPFNIERKRNTDAIRQIRPGGLSAVYEAVWLAVEQVLKPEFGRKALVLFSDGVDNRSESVSKEETLKLARTSDIPIYCLYFDTDMDRYKRIPRLIDPLAPSGLFPGSPMTENPLDYGFSQAMQKKHPEYVAGREYLTRLSDNSGGVVVDARRMNDLGPAFGKIAAELRSQYTIGYYPKNMKHDGSFRSIEVKVTRPQVVARTKRGYYDAP
jgi:Ca-activated chloride channel family protein